MSTVAAPAAELDHLLRDDVDNSVGETRLPGQRTALRSVLASGQSGDGGLDDPLRLGRAMRLRLLAAVQALLADPSIAGQSDVARLAAVVLYAKSRAPKGAKNDNQTSIWVAELGRWMGVGESTVNRRVLVPLRASDGLHTQVVRDAKGHPTGLDCLVMPLWNARKSGGAAHPLALSKAELATLLHLIEALFGPGWTPEDKEPTPPGLLAGRTGKGAATDRLGLLLMVLNTRASGWLQLCGGSVKAKEGRGAATLARLLGCSPSGARKVLARLTEAGVVAREHRDTATRMRGKGRVMLLPVAHAYGRRPRFLEAVQEPKPSFSVRPDGAVGDHGQADEAAALGASGIGGAEGAGDAAVLERPDSAELHADHASVVTPVVPLQLSCGFSGEGRGAEGRRPERACAGEDQAVDGETTVAGSGNPVADADPLRGEKPKKSPVDEHEQEQAGGVAAGAGARLTVVGGRKTQQQGRSELPADLDLWVALTPVSWLWQGLNRWQQDRVVEAAKLELAQLRNVLEWPAQAPSVLAARLKSRLEETGGEALITRPYGWITHRGLVRRPSCSDVRCDDGVRIDTGADCANCANILHSRRAWRVRIAAEVDQELPGLEQDARYREIETRMRRHAEAEAADLVARQAEARERAEQRAAARAEAEAQAAIERERAAAEAAARQAVACEDCGRERSARLCEACDHRRQTEALIGEAGLLAATWSADLADQVAVAAVAAEVRTAIEDAIAASWAQFQEITDPADLAAAGPDAVEDVAAHNAFLVAESAVGEYRHEALVMLGRSEDARAAARKAYATELAKPWHQALPDSDDAQRAATEAAAQAQTRTAEHLLAVRLEQLHTQARPEPVRPAPWSQRLPELAARPLDGETLEVIA
ncbi:hypothetical protein [Streptomyces lateritius]|uniref:hypothetical protein n=1 Tax=Streptomyces lateritius TaxID=67313 RepID=UPI00167AFAB9|nr:hypothetical protein [Streptomyces lateritius]GGU11127.1 hypothetical protein GCM10010272_65240 [Streptomyces lateritius]